MQDFVHQPYEFKVSAYGGPEPKPAPSKAFRAVSGSGFGV